MRGSEHLDKIKWYAALRLVLFVSGLTIASKATAQQEPWPPTLPARSKGSNVQEIPNQVQGAAAKSLTQPSEQGAQLQLIPPAGGAGRPPALEAQNGCDLWRGAFSGNDPSVLVEARLCTDEAGQVTGLVQWSSFTSGYNVREVSGTRGTNGQFSLRDRDFRAYHPTLPWRFCLIDRYMLIPQGPNHLVGSYASRGCSDHAHVELFRVSANARSAK